MNELDWDAVFFFTAGFAYVAGSLMGYMAGLFDFQYSWVLVPIWFGLGYFFIKHRTTYMSFFKAMWSGAFEKGKER